MRSEFVITSAAFQKPKIMIFCDYYLPGYKSGGGMRTIVNMVDRLHDDYDFRIVTRDHDGKLDRETYDSVDINAWNNVRNAQVYYLSKDNIRISKLRELILEVEPNVLYTNSFFATLSIYVAKLRKLKLIPWKNIVIAPCGELSEGSLKSKSKKKSLYLGFSKLSGIYKDIIWKASSQLEADEIEKVKGSGGKVMISPDLPAKSLCEKYSPTLKPYKKPGSAKMVFLSRVCVKKNLHWLPERLLNIEGKLEIDIAGPLEDREYWAKCESEFNRLPKNVKIRSIGSVAHEDVSQLLLGYHFLIVPTLSENFGHVFLEAMAAGCPLIISDRTPWLNLKEKGVGWDIPLESPEKWTKAVQTAIDLDQAEFSKISARAREFVTEWLSDDSVEVDTRKVLEEALSVTSTVTA